MMSVSICRVMSTARFLSLNVGMTVTNFRKKTSPEAKRKNSSIVVESTVPMAWVEPSNTKSVSAGRTTRTSCGPDVSTGRVCSCNCSVAFFISAKGLVNPSSFCCMRWRLWGARSIQLLAGPPKANNPAANSAMTDRTTNPDASGRGTRNRSRNCTGGASIMLSSTADAIGTSRDAAK
jgi:hypothetical protein